MEQQISPKLSLGGYYSGVIADDNFDKVTDGSYIGFGFPGASNATSDAASAGAASGKRSRQATSNQKTKATTKKDALDDALGDLNKSTNRLRRKFDATDTWMETNMSLTNSIDPRQAATGAAAAIALVLVGCGAGP